MKSISAALCVSSLLLAVLLNSGCSTTGSAVGPVVQIFYIPIGVETFIPITPENIVEHANATGAVNASSSELARTIALIRQAPAGDFSVTHVRVKMVFPDGGVILIDNVGGVNQRGVSKK